MSILKKQLNKIVVKEKKQQILRICFLIRNVAMPAFSKDASLSGLWLNKL